ncbi:glycoside hydrolase family 2 protein [Parapedobacter sp. 2B3]|uniref:glycoside hydrolase family 2 protein n=1 Tax=Parapedobacter sp. 2B3 TaxID=3342381 RepID=UPI0035B5D5B7
MIRLFLATCLALTIAPKGYADTRPCMTNVAGRNAMSLNGKWQAIVDWYDRGEQRRIHLDEPPKNKNSFNEYSFGDATLNIPADWNSQRPNLEYYEGVIWYKKEFEVAPEPGQRQFIHFGAVNYAAKVYLNGSLLGTHEGGFTPFQFEITDQLHPGKNKLIVKVDNRRSANGIPALNFDWWNYGGITRDVNLITTPASYIADYFIQLKKGSKDTIAGWLQLNGVTGSEPITISIPDAGIKHTFMAAADGYVSFAFHTAVERWSPSNPKLYHVEINSDHDQISEKIGFRNIDVAGDELLLNGEPIFLKGISIHEEIPQRKSRVASEADAMQLLLQARELGCNFIRTSHYPQHEFLIRKAEEMGFMLWEEIPIWQGVDFTSSEITEKAQTMLKDMISRDKNRCGVIIWSLSNETRPTPDRNRVLRALASFSRTLDPTRLIASAFDQFKYSGNKIIIDDPLSEDLDILAANKYMGWYTPWPAGPGNIQWETTYKKPLIISEFGAEAVYGNHGTADTASSWTEEYQAKVMEDNIRMFRSNPQLRGVCPWVLADFRSPTRMHSSYQNGWNRKGLLSEHGEKKKAWHVIRDYFADH